MKKTSESARVSHNLLSEKNQHLFQKYDILEKEWKEQRSLPNSNNPRRNSTGSSNGSSILTSFDQLQLLGNSPRELMSSLQRKISPCDTISWAENSCDDAVEEVVTDRKDVIMSGKLKGRRLIFDSIEVSNEVGMKCDQEDGGSGLGNQEVKEVVIMSKIGDGKMSRSRSSKGAEEEEENTVVEVTDVVEKSVGRRPRGGGRCMVVATAWLAILFVVFICFLISIRCNGKSVHGKLVPT